MRYTVEERCPYTLKKRAVSNTPRAGNGASLVLLWNSVRDTGPV